MIQFARYKSGNFEGKRYLEQAKSLTGAEWWGTLGKTGLPELAKVAVRVLSMVPAAAGCERNWSIMGAVGGKHARMDPDTMGKLVYVRSNLQLMHREHMKSDKDHAKAGVEWEVDEDLESDGILSDFDMESSDDESGSDEINLDT